MKLSFSPLSIAPKLHRLLGNLLACTLILIAIQGMAFGQTTPTTKTPRPKITKVNPREVSPAVYIDIEGHWLYPGMESDDIVFFVQGGVEYRTEDFGEGALDADPDGVHYLDARVPDELVAGPCQVIVEVKGRRSNPFSIEIISTITPPVLSSMRPRWAQPGEAMWIGGIGFSGSDVFEITDSMGHVQQIEGSKSAEQADFPLSNDLADGAASLRVVEQRSAHKQQSNSLSFIISHGPVPLDISLDLQHPLARGQILRLLPFSKKPLEQATAVELMLKQGGTSHSLFLKNLKDLRFQIPDTIDPGKIEIQNRTWRGAVASEWSDAVSYQVSRRPAPPSVHNIQIWPAKADAVFIQDGKDVATVPIIVDGLPRTSVPRSLKKGSTTVERRYRRAGRIIKGPSTDYSCCPLGSGNGILDMTDSDDWIFPSSRKPHTVGIFRGDVLIIEGDFFATQPAQLGVVLGCGRRSLQLKITPWFVDSRQWISVRIPRLMPRGNCSLAVSNAMERTKATLPIALRIK